MTAPSHTFHIGMVMDGMDACACACATEGSWDPDDEDAETLIITTHGQTEPLIW